MRYRDLFESDRLSLRVLPGDDLLRIINQNYQANADVFDQLSYLYPDEMSKEIHIVHFDGPKVVSSLALELNPYDNSEYWLKHVVVDENYRNRGLASELYQAAVDYAREHNRAIRRSSATDMGKQYLSQVVDRIRSQNPDVEIRD